MTTPSARGRGNSPADPARVLAAVRASLGWEPLPDPEPSPAELLPPDVAADPALARRILRNL